MTTATITHEVMDADWTVQIKTYQLSEGVTLQIFDNIEAALKLQGDEINFKWDYATENAFQSLDNITAMELLSIIARATL